MPRAERRAGACPHEDFSRFGYALRVGRTGPVRRERDSVFAAERAAPPYLPLLISRIFRESLSVVIPCPRHGPQGRGPLQGVAADFGSRSRAQASCAPTGREGRRSLRAPVYREDAAFQRSARISTRSGCSATSGVIAIFKPGFASSARWQMVATSPCGPA